MYGLLLLVLSLLSILQHRIEMTPPGEYLSVVQPDNQTVAVRHAVSEMRLFLSPDAPLKTRKDPSDLPIYGICGKEFWGLNVIDYALFSMMSYVGDAGETERTVRQLFPQNWRINVHTDDVTDRFWTEFSVNEKTTVIAVRGSEFWRVSDYLEDLRMWTEPVAKSMLTLAFPTVRAWSPKTTAMVFDAYQEFLAFIGIPDDLQYKYQRLLEYVNARKFENGRTVVLTGHSLGGGIASIVGAIAKLPTVTFLSPGMYQTASKFFYHSSKHYRQYAELMHNQSVSIQVENDFVGKYLDTHAGLVQTITCSVDHLAPLTCHLIDNSICNLVRHCKDPRWPGGCDFKYDFDIFLNATFPEESYQSLRHTLLEPIARKLNQMFGNTEVRPVHTNTNQQIRNNEL
jgi:lipase ATG15